MKHLCVIVSDHDQFVEEVQTGLVGSENEVVRVFAKVADCELFMEENEWKHLKLRVIVDTYVEKKLPIHDGDVRLDDNSPSTKLMNSICKECPEWRILAVTRPGCLNDMEIALQHVPQWFTHSSDVPTWAQMLPSKLEEAEQFHPLAIENMRLEKAKTAV